MVNSIKKVLKIWFNQGDGLLKEKVYVHQLEMF